METSHIVGGVASLAAVALGLFFHEGIKEALKKSFSDLSPQRVRSVFIILIIVCFAVVYGAGFGITAAIADEPRELPEETPEYVDTYQNDTIQAVVDLLKTGIEKTEEFVDNKRTRDSIELANRRQYWVYFIGNPMDDESAVWEAAMEVQGMGNVSVFKKERKNYIVICDPGMDKKGLEDSLSSYEAQLESIGVNARIEIVNLMDYCNKKETVMEIDRIAKRKRDETFKCLTCDK